MNMITLDDLIKEVEVLRTDGDTACEIKGIAFDSRKVEPGFVFVAVAGVVTDGHMFVSSAIEKGAVAVICESDIDDLPDGIVCVKCEDSAKMLGLISSRFYGKPSDQMKVVGITGTNGKTTIATVLYKLYGKLGYKAGLLSTNCNYIADEQIPSTHTTPDPIQINALMRRMVEEGCDYCFMEVSSHSIHQERIAGISFDGAVYTNLTHDHLDYHKTFIDYRDAKKKFFDDLSPNAFALTNTDDKNGNVMLQNTAARKFSYSLRAVADYTAKVLEGHFDGMLLSINGKEVWTHFVGNFNAANLLAVYGTAVLLGTDELEVLEQLSTLKAVDGRFETLRSSDGVFAVVDYAHTPDALKNVLIAINEIRSGTESLITVVGAGGDRDKSKRPEMAHEAVVGSDRVIITSDNPRSEEPEAIIADMMEGVDASKKNRVLSIANRKEAIRTACMMAIPGDIILVAGKGHEDYQEIKGVKHHFDDREVLREILICEN
jgi:UDP-N-acetylmuramoyl-L-alanyl-D-glutamate--2,6-diaminopimelate ligase